MLNYNLIRDRISMVAEPGIFTAQAIADVTKEAERYGDERAKETKEPRIGSKDPELADIRNDLNQILAVIKSWRDRCRK